MLKELQAARAGLVFDLVNGGTLRNGDATGEVTAKLVGIIYGIDLVLEIEEKADENE